MYHKEHCQELHANQILISESVQVYKTCSVMRSGFATLHYE